MECKHTELLRDVELFIAETGMGETYFGKVAGGGSTLLERLRSGGRVWPETEQKIRDFMAVRRSQIASKADAA